MTNEEPPQDQQHAAVRSARPVTTPPVGLLRAKFTQHPELAQVLLSTGDAGISCTGFENSSLWRDVPDVRGRSRMGRLPELTRPDPLAQQPLRTWSAAGGAR
ncbi:hypothetical protein ACFZAT_31595 [Streptomyces sp. NPDC008163]|uniref:hypothetical protein n=1 Tax=Streptomyces sp. NPDC008163 TaxID=3364818 RepID=UPI0036E8D234